MISMYNLTMIYKVSAVVVGSGWSIVAQTAAGGVQNIHVYGGWGLAVVGLITLWKELKEERQKRDKIIEDYHEKAEEREKVYAKKYQERDEEFVKAINNNADATRQLEESHRVSCYAHRVIKPDKKP